MWGNPSLGDPYEKKPLPGKREIILEKEKYRQKRRPTKNVNKGVRINDSIKHINFCGI